MMVWPLSAGGLVDEGAETFVPVEEVAVRAGRECSLGLTRQMHDADDPGADEVDVGRPWRRKSGVRRESTASVDDSALLAVATPRGVGWAGALDHPIRFHG